MELKQGTDSTGIAPYFLVKITVWVILALNSSLILYSLYLIGKVVQRRYVFTQKVMLQTIAYTSLSLSLISAQYSGYQWEFYSTDNATPTLRLGGLQFISTSTASQPLPLSTFSSSGKFSFARLIGTRLKWCRRFRSEESSTSTRSGLIQRTNCSL